MRSTVLDLIKNFTVNVMTMRWGVFFKNIYVYKTPTCTQYIRAILEGIRSAVFMCTHSIRIQIQSHQPKLQNYQMHNG